MAAIAARLGEFDFGEVIGWDWTGILSGLITFVVGSIVVRIAARLIVRGIRRSLRDQSRELVRKALLYTGTAIVIVVALNTAGVSVAGLLGAAGVLGIAVGIASQASLSNVISGLFLVSERFFEVGDVVRTGTYTGIVAGIDLLSIKLKTFDNVLIRVPNQALIEAPIVNITRYPIRRMDLTLTTPFSHALGETLRVLRSAADETLLVLEEPEPFVMLSQFSERGVEVILGVWFEHRNYVAVRNAVAGAVQQAFTREGLSFEVTSIRVDGGVPGEQRGTMDENDTVSDNE